MQNREHQKMTNINAAAFNPVEAQSAQNLAGFEPATNERVHTVAAGDTLSGLAKKYGVKSWKSIQTLNNLRGTVIRIGQKLRIPTPPRPNLPQAAATHTYVAKPGENLNTIAADLLGGNGTPQQVANLSQNLQHLNGQKGTAVWPGRKLTVPNVTPPKIRTHIAKVGENLVSLATGMLGGKGTPQQVAAAVDYLKQLNGQTTEFTYPGQPVLVPESGAFGGGVADGGVTLPSGSTTMVPTDKPLSATSEDVFNPQNGPQVTVTATGSTDQSLEDIQENPNGDNNTHLDINVAVAGTAANGASLSASQSVEVDVSNENGDPQVTLAGELALKKALSSNVGVELGGSYSATAGHPADTEWSVDLGLDVANANFSIGRSGDGDSQTNSASAGVEYAYGSASLSRSETDGDVDTILEGVLGFEDLEIPVLGDTLTANASASYQSHLENPDANTLSVTGDLSYGDDDSTYTASLEGEYETSDAGTSSSLTGSLGVNDLSIPGLNISNLTLDLSGTVGRDLDGSHSSEATGSFDMNIGQLNVAGEGGVSRTDGANASNGSLNLSYPLSHEFSLSAAAGFENGPDGHQSNESVGLQFQPSDDMTIGLNYNQQHGQSGENEGVSLSMEGRF